MIYNNVLEAMGNTPMIRLNKMVDDDMAEILVKYEGVNIGGSVKTRTAFNMIEEAEKSGLINNDTIIVEPTSGNQGIGIALVGAVKGYKVKIVMPDSVSEERRKLVKHYGAEVILIHDDGNIGACIEECLNTALRMAANDPKVFVPQQFENPHNPEIHYLTTAPEIYEDLNGKVDIFVSGLGSGGTLQGISQYLKEKNPNLIVCAVEPKNVSALLGDEPGLHQIQGIGDGFIPEVLDTSLIDEVVTVTDDDAMNTTRDLARVQGLLCGTSSGANIWACKKMAEKYGKDKIIATVLPDRMERYFSTGLL